MTSLDHALRRILAVPTCIVGVGNPFRNDDAVGAMVAERLQRDLPMPSHLCVVNAEDVIENHVFRIADGDASNVLVIDAVRHDGAEPGSLVLGRMHELEAAGGAWSTHKLTLTTAASVLRHHGKDVYLLGIVAADTDYGTQVGAEILAGAEAVINMVVASSRE